MRTWENKFELDVSNEPETAGELPPDQPGDAEAWAALGDVPFAGDTNQEISEEQALSDLEDQIPPEDIAATELATQELESLADASISDTDDGTVREDAAFDVRSGEWIPDSADSETADLDGLADSETTELGSDVDISGLADSDASDSGIDF